MFKEKIIEHRLKPNDHAEVTIHLTIPGLKELLAKQAELEKLIRKEKIIEQYIDDVDLTTRLHISRKTTAKYRNQGLQFIKINKKIFYKPEWIEEFFARYTQKAF